MFCVVKTLEKRNNNNKYEIPVFVGCEKFSDNQKLNRNCGEK